MHPASSSLLLHSLLLKRGGKAVQKSFIFLHCLQKAPLFLVLDLALVHSSTPSESCALWSIHWEEAAVTEREKGDRARRGVCVCVCVLGVIFRNVIDIRLILYVLSLRW